MTANNNKKSITTLVEDIYRLMEGEIDLDETKVQEFSERLSSLLVARLTRSSYTPALRMSNFGKPDRQLWFSINMPEKSEPLLPKTRLKFLFGDILEELLLFLAEEAGHEVTGLQDELVLDGMTGHRDAVIDGVTVDVKSANARSFKNFESAPMDPSNPFQKAYIDQIGLYLEAGKDDPLVKEKDYGAFLAFDKEMGGICLNYQKKPTTDYRAELARKREMLAQPEPPEEKCYSDEPDGKSGNMKLALGCRYCSFKEHCWPEVRTFFYSNGPRFLTKVERVPDVPEKQ